MGSDSVMTTVFWVSAGLVVLLSGLLVGVMVGGGLRKIEAKSFRGDLYLLIIDKIIIGAVIAACIFVYDRWRVSDQRAFEERSARADLTRELLPILLDPEVSGVARAYMLGTAVRTEVLDGEAAFEIGLDLRPDVSSDHFRRVMTALIPSALPAVSRLGMAISRQSGEPANGGQRFASRQEWLAERRLWKEMVLDAVPAIEQDRVLETTPEIARSFYGLFLLMKDLTPESQLAERLIGSQSYGVSLMGHVLRLLTNGDELSSLRYLRRRVLNQELSLESVELQRAVLASLSDRKAPPCGRVAGIIAEFVVRAPTDAVDSSESLAVAHREMQIMAIDLLDRMGGKHHYHDYRRPQCVDAAVPILVQEVGSLLGQLDQPYDSGLPRRTYGSGELIGQFVARVLACHPGDEAVQTSRAFYESADELKAIGPFLHQEPSCDGVVPVGIYEPSP